MPIYGRLILQAALVAVIASGELAFATTSDKEMKECMALLSAGHAVPAEQVANVLASLLPQIDIWKNANAEIGAAFYARAAVGDIPINVAQMEFLGAFATAEFLPGLEGLLRALEYAAGRVENISITILGMKLERNVMRIQERVQGTKGK
ncbi:MAG: hypothetical protein ACXVA9_07045 [Bdellovibrionales bacterium]